MLNFRSFIIEDWVDPKSGINEPVWFPRGIDKKRPLSIFTQAAGYGRDWDLPSNYNPRSDALVHTTDYFPENGKIRTQASAQRDNPVRKVNRETIHFTRNGIVGKHTGGSWEGKPFTVILPQGPVKERFVAHGDHDTWVLGDLEMPNGSKIMVHEPSLTGEQKANLAKLAGVENYDQISERLTKGLDVDFDGRKITLKNTKGDVTKAVEAELRSLGIEPLNIGSEQAGTFVTQRPEFKLPKDVKFGGKLYFEKARSSVSGSAESQKIFSDMMQKSRLGALESPWGDTMHITSPFAKIEGVRTPGTDFALTNPNDLRVFTVDNSGKPIIDNIVDRISRPLFPEEQEAVSRIKEWQPKIQEWLESQRKEYDKNPEEYMAKQKEARAVQWAESDVKKAEKVSNAKRSERLQAEKEASAEAVRKYQSGEFVPPQKPEPQQTRVQEPESPKFSEDIAGLSPEGVVPKGKLAKGLRKIGSVAAEAVPMAFGDYAAREAGQSLGMGEQDAEMAGLAGSFAVPVAMSAAGMGAGPQAAVTIPGYVGGRLLAKGNEAIGLGDLETSAMTKLSNAWVSGKEGFKSDTDKVWNPQAGKYMTAKETSDFLRKQSEIERATDLTKGFASPEEAEAHFKRMKDDPEYKRMIDWRMAKAGQREAERQQGGSAVMARAMGTDAAETLIPDWVTNIGEYDPLGRATSAALDAAGYIPGAKKLGKKFVDVLGWLEKD